MPSIRRAAAACLALGATLGAARAEDAGPLPFVPVFVADWDGVGRATVDDRGIRAALADGGAKLAVGGRLYGDVGAAEAGPGLAAGRSSADAAVRRAWIEPRLMLPGGVTLSLQYDFSRTSTPVKDALVAYAGAEPLIVAAGQFKEPFSLDQLEASNDILFTERSLLDVLAPGRDAGVIAGVHGERWSLAGGAFGGNVNADAAGEGIAGTARATYAPLLADGRVVHLGLAGSYRALGGGGTAPSFSEKPESFLFPNALVDTGALRGAEAVGRVDAEFAAEWDPFRMQAEVARVEVASAAGPDRSLSAAYAEASWVVGGHQPRYRVPARFASEYGVFEGVKVPDAARVSHGGFGVFEFALRLSAVDLGTGPLRGGAERNVAAGVNWYPDKDIRLMADVVRARADPSAGSVTGRRVDASIFTGRLQIAW